MKWKIKTRSGSIYFVRNDADGKWWLSADNVPNHDSNKFPEGVEYEVLPPLYWPPTEVDLRAGWRLWLEAPPLRSPKEPPHIMRSGMIITSRVDVFEEVAE